MSEFGFSLERDVEEPLYLDSADSRPANSRPPNSRLAADLSEPRVGADRPLHLDLAREPRRKRRRGGLLLLACALTFILGVGAGALILEPPATLRDIFAPATTGHAEIARQAAPVVTEPAPERGSIPASQTQAAPAPAAIPDAPPTSGPLAEPPAKPRATPRRAAAPKTHAADARSAHAPRKSQAPLDLDALEKSLHGSAG
jgi:hypothetical protein